MKKFLNVLLCGILVIISSTGGISQTWLWEKNISGTDTVSDRAVSCDQYNNIYVIGTFMGTANFDGTHSLTANSGCTDYFIAKYDQSGNLLWVMQGATTAASTKNNFGRNIVFDGNGNLYITGFNSQTAAFNNGISIVPNSIGTSSGFILKVSSSGSALASLVYAYGSAIGSESIATDQSGNLTISGNYTGNLNLYGSSSSYPVATSKNHFIVQYTGSFGFNWANTFTGSTTTTKLISVCRCTNQGYYAGGFLRGSLTIGPTTLYSKAGVGEDIVLIKLDNSGNVLWIRQAGSLQADRCDEVQADNSGNAYYTGYINSATINFDSTGTGIFDSRGYASLGGYDCIVAKYNPQGKFLWAKILGDAYYQIGYGIAVADSNIAITGTFAGTMSINNTISTGSYNEDIFVGSIDKNGTPLYSSRAGGTKNVEDRGERITYDNNKNILITGFYYSNPLKFGTDSIIPGATPNVFLAKYQSIVITPTITNVSCPGGSDGSVSISIAGGTAPFTYLWSTGATSQNISNLGAGSFSVTATDANSAKATGYFLVTQSSGNVAADSAKSSPAQVCTGSSTTLSLSGGNLDPVANWHWYSLTCGGTVVGTGNAIVVSPVVTTEFYVRAEDGCSTTSCASALVTIRTFSSPATSASANPSTVCYGSPVTLNVSGGTLASGDNWIWYASTCGGTYSGSGLNKVVTPSATTTYYVRAEGFCGSSTCVSTLVAVSVLSSSPSSASVTPAAICPGSSSTLSLTGGTLGTGADWVWYSLSCGGTLMGTGATIIFTPVSTTTYYVRAEGACNTTSCVNVTDTLNSFSVSATSATSSPSSFCLGGSSTLALTGGTLGTRANWYWYSVTCGGTLQGNGAMLTVTPSITTTYYVRAEGFCGSSTCVSTIVTVNQLSVAATSASSSASKICSGSSTTLSFTGGSLGTGAYWKWWSGSCGGISRGTGVTLVLSPTVTTTYYLRAQGTCNTTTCVSTIVIVNSTAATSASASPAIITYGSTSTLTEAGGTLGLNSIWYWYSGSCGGISSGTGTSIVVSDTISTIYYVRVEGTCNTTNCVSVTVSVCTNSSPATSASSSPQMICSGSSSTLTLTGGSPGVGAIWKWWSGSCGGVTRGTGVTIVLAPTITTTYYVRAQGLCNSTACVSTMIIVNSTAATSATAAPATIAPGSNSTLLLTGGVLGLNAAWYWYSVSCGGTFAGTGTTTVQSPTANTIYYVRAESSCYTTTCVSVTISVCSASSPANSASASPASMCSGSSSTLSFSGGTLGNMEVWKWWSSSCGVGAVGTGSTIVVTPSATTTYYLRAQGTCNTTTCVSVIVIVNSTAATSATASPPNISSGSSTTISENGGILGPGSGWYWYSVSCGGTFISTGLTIVQSPTIDFTYYVRAEGTCNTTACVSTIVSICSNSSAPVSISATATTVCGGDSTILTPQGGSLGNGANWYWYTGSCGGTLVNSGSPVKKKPTGSITFWVRAQSSCNTTTCASVYINYLGTNRPATAVSASPSTINSGSSSTLTETGSIYATGGKWYWYSNSCGGTLAGTGSSKVVTPTTTTVYYVRSENGTCTPSACISVTVTVNATKISMFNDIAESSSASSKNDLLIFPNPANEIINIRYNIAKDCHVTISFYNILGEKITDIIYGYQVQGSHTCVINLSGISPGVYSCKMIIEREMTIDKKFVISK